MKGVAGVERILSRCDTFARSGEERGHAEARPRLIYFISKIKTSTRLLFVQEPVPVCPIQLDG